MLKILNRLRPPDQVRDKVQDDRRRKVGMTEREKAPPGSSGDTILNLKIVEREGPVQSHSMRTKESGAKMC